MSEDVKLLIDKYGPFPEKLKLDNIKKLIKKSINIYPIIDNLYNDVSSWLKEEGLNYKEEQIDYKTLKGETLYLKAFDLDKLIIILVDDYTKFNKKVCNKNIAREIHDRILSTGKRIVWCKKFEWENLAKRKVMKSLILHGIGRTKWRYFARKTEAVIVENSKLKDFFDECSFYGFRPAKNCVALKDKTTGKYLMALSFGHAFYAQNKTDEKVIECIRSSSLPNSIIVGGMSKLMKFYVENFQHEFDKIIFYCDDAHHQSSSMDAIGFKFSHRTENGVHNVFTETGAMMMRTPALHSEIMWAQQVGFISGIPDVGNTTHIFTKGNQIGFDSDLII